MRCVITSYSIHYTKLYDYQHYGIAPDIVTMAKGVASGYAAISCTVTTERVYKLLQEADATDTLRNNFV